MIATPINTGPSAYTGPTPYDGIIASYEKDVAEANIRGVPGRIWDNGHALVLARAEGYRRAMQDYAPLLEAAKAVLASWEAWCGPGLSPHDGEPSWVELCRAAIAAAEGRNQPASPHPRGGP